MTTNPQPPNPRPNPPGGASVPGSATGKAAVGASGGPGTLQADGSRWIWPFRLTERIGVGGMGEVYRGQFVPKKIEVAVKMLPEDVTDPVVLQRFERELEVLKSLRHPNIVRCFGGVCEDDVRFYAMELVTGGTLEDLLRARGRLSWEQVVEYGQQMAAALSAAHAKSVVHRDLKPANFLITGDGKLKLADFGLAFIEAKRRITRAGKTAGTVLYMSPEQIRGREVAAASDLYSLGCVLYEMLSGNPPFDGDAQATILHAHVMTPPPRLASLVMDCPAELEQLVHKLLQKDPADRPRSADEVSLALRSMTPDLVMAEPRRTGGTGNQPLTLPATSAPPPTPLDRTKSLPKLPRVAAQKAGWVVPSLAGLAALLAATTWWQWSSAASLDAYRQAWISEAATAGGNQVAAIAVLGRLGAGDAEVIRTLQAAMDSPDASVRAAAATSAGELDSGDMDLNGRLRQLAKGDESDIVRSAATRALTD